MEKILAGVGAAEGKRKGNGTKNARTSTQDRDPVNLCWEQTLCTVVDSDMELREKKEA